MLELIIGRAGTGKTSYCLEKISKFKTNSLLILPEHMTHRMERELSNRMDGGFLQVDVCGFRKLSQKILSEIGGAALPRITEIGANLMLRKILAEFNESELRFFYRSIGQRGFSQKMSRMLSEFHSYNFTPETLIELADKIGDSLLADKLRDFSMIGTKFSKELEGRAATQGKILDEAIEKLPKSQELRDAEIFIDGFVFFNPQEKKIISQLLQIAKNIHITLTMNPDKNFSPENHKPSGVFNRNYRTFIELNRLANELGIDVSTIRLEKNLRTQKKSLAALERNLYDQFPKPIDASDGAIKIFESTNRRREVECVAGDILRLCREQNYRFKDIGILIRDENSYGRIIPPVFKNFGIPVFIDFKRAGASHPLAMLIRSTLEIFHGWKYDSIFASLRTYFFPLTYGEIDRLENFVLENGIKGARRWKESKNWNELDEIRQKFMTPMLELESGLKRRKVIDKVKAILKFFETLEVEKILSRWMDEDESNGFLTKSREHNAVWNLIMDLFDQVVTILGEDEISRDEFEEILLDGLDSMEISLIPPALDEVTVSDLGQNALANLKAIYVLGCDDENFPPRSNEKNLLSDADRLRISEAGMEISLGEREQALSEKFLVYRSLMQPREYLWISYSIANSDGKAISQASILDRIKKIFPKLERINERELLLPRAESQLGTIFRQRINSGKSDPIWNDVYNFNLDHDRKNLSGLFYRASNVKLSKDLSKKLYASRGKLLGSVTRFENFHRCPFQHFACYGLRLQPRREGIFEPLDLGTFLHAIMRDFGKEVKNRNEMWKDQDSTKIFKEVQRIIDKLAPDVQAGILQSSAQMEHQLERIRQIAISNITRLAKFDKQSKFHPEDYEIEFGKSGNEKSPLTYEINGVKLEISGQIDRLDVSQDRFVIIDYKTSDMSLDASRIYWGLQMQLLTYLLAAKILTQEKAAGAIYCILRLPKLGSLDKKLDDSQLTEKVSDDMKMPAWTILDQTGKIDPTGAFIKITKSKTSQSEFNDEEFDLLLKFIDFKLRETGDQILNGEIDAKPFRMGSENACDYCDYHDLCRFDQNISGFKFNDMEKFAISDVFTKMKKSISPQRSDQSPQTTLEQADPPESF